MFGKDNKILHPHIINIIQHGTSIEGTVNCEGDLRLDGSIKGDVKITGRLVMGHDAAITGDIICEDADVAGKIFGNINVKETLTLKKQSRLTGDIATKKLIVENGAEFNGKCNMLVKADFKAVEKTSPIKVVSQ